MVYKACVEKGCSGNPGCGHHYYINVMVKGIRERGPVTKYAAHCPVDHRGLPVIPTTKAGAVLLEAAVRSWVSAGRPAVAPPPAPGAPTPPPPAPEPTGPTVREAIGQFRQHVVAEQRDKSTASILARLEADLGDRPILVLSDRIAARTFLAGIQRKAGTVNRYQAKWSALRSFCVAEYALGGASPFFNRSRNRNGLKNKNEGAPRSRRLGDHPVLGDDEEPAIRRALAALDDGGMMLARFDVALDCALRRGEMLAMTPADVKWNYQSKGLHLHVRWNTAKAKHERYIPVESPRVMAFLQTRRFVKGRVFGQLDGAQISESQFRDDWTEALAVAGVNRRERGTSKGGWHVWTVVEDGDLNWHDLRHEAASRLAVHCQDIRALSYLLGHTIMATTQRYINPTLNTLRDVMKRAQA
jgi:integrase